MKNLDFALRVLSQVRTSVWFSIYGPKEDLDYWHECERLISTMPDHIKVYYEGSIANERVSEAIAGMMCFFFRREERALGMCFWRPGLPGSPCLLATGLLGATLKRGNSVGISL